jgi:predicted DNA-binding transcriptional regulator AlpA
MNTPTFSTPIGQALWAVHAPKHPDRLLTTEEAADISRNSKTYLETLRSRGGGPEYVKIGNRVYYELVSFIQWIESRMKTHR